MRRAVLMLGVGLIASGLASAEECEPAVDVAESMDVNAATECDYEGAGLNGVVQGWFKRDQSSSANSENQKTNVVDGTKTSPPLGDGESLAKARGELLMVINKECENGFRVMDELYLPKRERLTVTVVYECL